MSAREELESLLERDGIPFERTTRGLLVRPRDENGFAVELAETDDGTPVVYFEGWHEGEPAPERALDLFGLGLSDACRLRVVSTGGKDHSWTMEWWDPEAQEWMGDSTTALLVHRVFGKRRERVLQNTWLTREELALRK